MPLGRLRAAAIIGSRVKRLVSVQRWTLESPKGRRPFGERRSSGMNETCRLRRGERYGACDDEGLVQGVNTCAECRGGEPLLRCPEVENLGPVK